MSSPPGPDRAAAPARAWHALDPGEVLAALDSGPHGLSPAAAAQRLQHYGPNRLKPPQGRPAWRRLLAQFHNLLIYVLLGAAAMTAVLGHWVDTGVILAVVVINALIGFVQEGKAEQALAAIRSLLSLEANVLRDGETHTLPAEQLVPGDVVQLSSGDKVPADLRLLRLRDLRVDESLLTGESLAVDKDTTAVADAAPLGDRRCMAYSGTLVAYGQATGVVVATGDATEIGRISTLLGEVQTLETPLLRQMAAFARVLSLAIVAVAALTMLYGVLIHGASWTDMFFAAVGLAVAAIPEGLPAIMTITLAIGVQRMAARRAIIRRLPAVETLGSVSVICSDKTGTLTRNEMTVANVVTATQALEVEGVGYGPHGGFRVAGESVEARQVPGLIELARAGLLCNEASIHEHEAGWRLQGDPTEGALVTLAHKAGLEGRLQAAERPRTDVIPFESEHRFMASLHHDHAGHGFIYVKGAPERLLGMCASQREQGEDRPLKLAYWEAAMQALADQGQRILALAERPAAAGQGKLRFDDVDGGLTLLGLVGIMDPPREEATRAIADCHAAGIEVKMITGDHARTALAIAARMGLAQQDAAITGAAIEAMDDAALAEAVRGHAVFARTSPEHKLRLVEALQAQGRVVAMTGDGVNDAPALKRADVGVAMGCKGTEAAKEAAEMVLADDNFASIAHAVEEGRTVYDNLRKAILFILPTNGGEALTIMAAILLGFALPITPVQILWVNMITAVTLALALAFEPAEADVMRRAPRRPDEPLLSGLLLWRVGFVSLILVAATFGMFLWERFDGADLERARTAAVNTLVACEIFYLFNARRQFAPALSRAGLLGNPVALYAVGVLILFQLAYTYAPPLQALFGSVALGAGDWLRILLVASSVLWLVELEKWLWRRRGG